MKSLAELQAIRDKMRQQIDLRDSGDDRIRVVVGMATCGIAAGARPVLNAFLEEVAKRELKNVTVSQTGCIGVCRLEPIVEVYVPGQEKVTYVKMTPDKVASHRQRASGQRPRGDRVHHRRGGIREEREMSLIRSHILVCTGTGCTSSESPKIIAEFEKQLAAQGMDKEAQVVRTGCFGLCALGPIVTIYPEGACYTHVTVDDVEEIVSEHIVKGRIVKRLLNRNEGGDGPATSLAETRFYKHQHRIALRNCGVINPESIDEYIGVDGYAALGKILTEHIPPQQVIDTVLASGLRGRGGAGFPTGKKWQFTADAVSPDGVKYVCCNADEGDPGAFMDRSVLEGDPHTILEAMTIAGYAVGAHQGYIYVRAEYPIAVKRLETAIRQAKEYGLLGKNIFDSGFDFDLELRLGAGAFVCGEETALMTLHRGPPGRAQDPPPFPGGEGPV